LAAAGVRFISEALAACPLAVTLPASLLKRYQVQKVKNAGEKKARLKDEVEVSVEDLAPGMKLTRPLRTRDGMELLEGNQRLDEDLIWRLWQLAGVRPVESATISRPAAPAVGGAKGAQGRRGK
jgi:hypothetical protein